MMVLMRFRNMRLIRFRWMETAGRSCPNSAPAIIDTRIQVVRDFFRQANQNNCAMTIQRETAGIQPGMDPIPYPEKTVQKAAMKRKIRNNGRKNLGSDLMDTE
jgi:hypothetical protein